MNRSRPTFRLARHALTALTAFAASAALTSAWSADTAALERWRSYSGVTWEAGPASQGAPAAAFRNSVNAPIAGIHFDAKDRAFVSTPRLISADTPATLSLLDTSVDGGPARLAAFPSETGNATNAAPALHLRNVLGFHIDRRNGWLWALDMGFVAGEAEAPAGGQKIVVYALATGRVVKRIALDGVADRKGSFLNDIAVDEGRRVAYLSDSGLRSAPRNQAAIIVADFDSARVRRVLSQHPSVMPEAGAKVVSHDEEVWPGNPLVLGINGIALSPDARTLYWTVTTGTKAFAIDTAALRDTKADSARVAAAVRTLGDVGGNTDGIVTDAQGRLYITDVTRNGIVRYDPASRAMTLIAADDGVFWPDTPTITTGGDLLFTASRLNGHFAGAVKAGSERYDLWRLRLAR
ncbi:L-dopachrome tautomerase-related protein [Mitsuaria sp. 7]|uniref:L-dopachrome tautomerase-related protein n=1 Tax=Mitsuaria sp. 7 TaxID=1658665 RepID=UPI0007DD543C|nr:L-dopachrome tautomerase-related protein [Mitsuaria sp. 7]ANH66672.1 major royal jelly protein [Mitsuaria sp. 7]